MIKVYYRNKIVCHIASKGANMAQVKACMEIVAEKMNVSPEEIRLLF